MADTITVLRGTLNARTRAMLLEAKRLAEAELGIPLTFVVVQGGRSKGSLSANTHAGEGAVDLQISHWTTKTADTVLKHCINVGFAGWRRGPRAYDTFDPHLHLLAISEPALSVAAKAQVVLFRAGLDGLVRRWRDSRRPAGAKPTTWEAYQMAKAAEWWHVDPAKVKTQLLGLSASRAVKTRRGPGYPLWIVRFEDRWGRRNAVTAHGTYYAAAYLAKGKA